MLGRGTCDRRDGGAYNLDNVVVTQVSHLDQAVMQSVQHVFQHITGKPAKASARWSIVLPESIPRLLISVVDLATLYLPELASHYFSKPFAVVLSGKKIVLAADPTAYKMTVAA